MAVVACGPAAAHPTETFNIAARATDTDGVTGNDLTNTVALAAGGGTQIYRSVGPANTNVLACGTTNGGCTGQGNLTIVGSTATFAAAIANTIGVGDAIYYDCSANSALGAADCVAFIHGRSSSTVYTVKNAAGAAPTAYAAAAFWNIYRAYTSLPNAEDGTENTAISALDAAVGNFDSFAGGKNIDASSEIWNIAIYADAADTAQIGFSGWTTSATEYLRVFVPYLSSEVGTSQRHSGVWDSTKSRVIASRSDYLVYADVNHIRIEGLQFRNTFNGADARGIVLSAATAPGSQQYILGNIFDYTGTTPSGNNYAIINVNGSNSKTLVIANNLSTNFEYGVAMGAYGATDNFDAYFYNNTTVNGFIGINVNCTAGAGVQNLYVKNNLSYGNVADFYLTNNCDTDLYVNNASGDGTADDWGVGGSGNRVSQTFSFVDASSNDYRLSNSDTAAINQGTNLSADAGYAFTTDIARSTRAQGASWDIGAFEAPEYIMVDDDYASNEFDDGIESNVEWSGSGLTLPSFSTADRQLSSPDCCGFDLTGLRAIWHLDEATISSVSPTSVDVLGLNNCSLVTDNAGANKAVTGKVGGGIEFDMVDEYLSCGSDASIDDMTAITMSAWIKPYSSGSSNNGNIIRKGAGDPLTDGWRLDFPAGFTGDRGLRLSINFAVTDLVVITSTQVPFNTWTNVTFTWDGSTTAANVKIYFNGVEAAYSTQTNGSGAYTTDNTRSLAIGARAGTTVEFDGAIDEVALFERVLSLAEVGDLYDRNRSLFDNTLTSTFESRIYDTSDAGAIWQDFLPRSASLYAYSTATKELPTVTEISQSALGVNPTDINAYFRLNQTSMVDSGTDAVAGAIKSTVPSTLAGTVSTGDGAAEKAITGKFNGAFDFDGTNDSISMTDNAAYNIDLNTNHSWSAWAKPDALAGQAYRKIWDQEGGTGSMFITLDVTETASLCTLNYTGALTNRASIYISDGTNYICVNTISNVITLGAWHHVVVTYTAANTDAKKVHIYINGVDFTGHVSSSGALSTAVTINNTSHFIGSGSATHYFDGIVDEYAYWNKALSDTEVKSLYHRGSGEVRLKYQLRSCDDGGCAGETFVGSGNTNGTYFTDLVSSAMNGFSNFLLQSMGLSANRHFQYKVWFESDDLTYSPDLRSVKARASD